ncbi:MAG: Calx-beta domain-containing protein, partial [Acutalibacteraceae bacterium]
GSIEFAIIRAGNNDKEATVKFKAVDVSADYGDDYKIAVPGWFGDDELKADEDSGIYKQQLKDAQDTPAVFDGKETPVTTESETSESLSSTENQDTAQTGTSSETSEETPTETVLSPTDEVGTDLQSAKELLTDEKGDRKLWTEKTIDGEDSGLTTEELSDAYNDTYSELPGAECELTFAPGETYKKLKFIVVDDDKSEDDEIAMLVLTDAKGADLVDNPSGLINIKDNDESEKSEFVIDEDEITVKPNEDKAILTIRRTKGISHYGEATISTASDTAESGIYYNPVSDTLSFSAEQEYRKIEIPIIKHPESSSVSFNVRVDESDSAKIVIQSDSADNSNSAAVKIVRYAPFDLNTADDTTFDNVPLAVNAAAKANEANETINYWKYKKIGSVIDKPIIFRYQAQCLWYAPDTISMSGVLNYDLANYSPGTYYDTRWWFFGSEGYYKDFYTYLYLNGKTNSPYQFDLPIQVIVNKAGTIKNNCKGDYYLTDSDRQKATSIKYGTWYEKDTKDTDARFYYMDLYGIPIRIRLISGLSHEGEESGKMKRSDEDSWLHTKTYTSPTDYERTKDKDAKYIGGLSFEDGSGLIYKEKGQKETTDENIFYKDDVITVKSDFTNSQLSEKERENIYLWGVKIKSTYTDYGYYYVEGNHISVNDLYQGKLKGYHVDTKTGKITYGNVPVDKTNYNEKFQGHNAPLFEIYPVYRQKTANIQLNIDNTENVTIAEGTFKDGDIMTIGKLDTINYSIVPKDRKTIYGYEWYSTNYLNVCSTSDKIERQLYSRLYDKSIKEVNKETQKYLFELSQKYYSWHAKDFVKYTSGVISITPADLYVENQSIGRYGNDGVGFVNLKLRTKDSVINMAVNPAAYPEYQNKVIVSSADPETGKALTAEYTGTYKKTIEDIERTLCKGLEINLKGYSMSERYNFFPKFKEEADTKNYKVVWNDRTGDTNRDGNYSAAEMVALGEYYDLIEKNGMSGDYFTFVSEFPIDRQLYYSVVPKVPSDVENVISGTVYYKGKSVLDNTNGKEGTKTPASGVEVVVNGMTTVTDDNGNFKFKSKDFAYNEIYNVIFNNGSSDWTQRITVGCPANVEYDEYNTFNVNNLQAEQITIDTKVINDHKYTATEKNPDTEVYNDDHRYLFTFTINPIVSGFEVGKSEVYLYSKDGTLKKTYDVKLLDAATKKYAISPKLNNEKKKNSGYYSFNPAQEGISAGDYLTVRVFDQNGIGYIEHKLGISFKKYIGAIAIINSFEAPYNGIIEYLGKADTAFDLGISTAIENKVGSLVTITSTRDEETDEIVKNISYGWSKDWKGKYDSSKKKKEKPEDEAKALVKDEDPAPPAEEESKEEESKAEESSGEDPAPPADVTDADKSKEADDLVEDSKDNKKSAKLTSNYKLDLKIAFSLKMRYNEEKESWYFDDFVIVATLSGEVSAKYSYATPVGISIYVTGCIGGDITGIIGVERYENNKLYFQAKGTDDDPRINLADSMGMYGSDRKLTFYGGLRLKPYVSLGVGAELPLGLAKLELNGKAEFDMYFDTRGTREGSVKLSGKLILELLFGLISKEYSLGEYKYNMFETSPMNLRADGATYSRANNLLRQNSNDARYEVVTEEDYSDALTNNNKNIKWNGKTNPNGETTLQKIVYTDAEPYVESIIGNRQFMLWVDDNIAGVDEEGYNISSVAYSICENGVWSEPEIIDKVSEIALTPYMYKINDSKLLILWSSTDMSFEEAENNMVVRINSNSIKGCFFDADTNTFSKIDYITKNTSADRFADHTPNVAYYETDGKKYLMVSYFKEEYQQAVSDEEVTVGDLLNPYKTIAYRFYDFEKEEWIDSYMGDAAEKLKVLSPSQRETFEKNWYGQNFVDFAKYVYVDESRISDGNGYWNERPTSDEVKLTGIGKDYLILSFDTIGYKDKVISAYCIDIDGNTETTNDRDIFVKVYDYRKNREYNAIRITNDNREQGSDVRLLYDERGGVNLFYVDNGNFVEYDVKQLIDNGFTMKSQDGTEVWLFDKSDSDYNKPETVVEAKEGKPLSGFSAFLGDDGHIYVMWTEYGVTYKDGIDPNSEEAIKPENQLVERQINIIANSVDFEESQLYDKDGNALVYPEKDNDGNIIDYNAIQDINGLKGVVKAGDLILKNVRTETWTKPVTLTDEKGANYSGIDATVTSENILRFVYLKNMSMVLTDEKSGEKYAGIDKDNPELCTADFDLGKADYSLKFSNIEDIISGQKNTNIAIDVTNNNVSLAKDVEVQLYIDNEFVGSNVIPEINGGATVSTVISCDIPESINGKVMKAVALDDGKEIESTEEILTYADNWALESVDTEFVDRNTVKLTATVYNNGEEKSSGLVIHTELNGRETTDSEPFDLEIGETKTVEWTVPVKDSNFEVSTLDDGTIQEKATITVKSVANDIDTAVIRSATKEQADIAANIKDIELSDLESGKKLGTNIKLGTDKLLGLNIKGIFNSDTENGIDVRYVSSDESVVKVVNDVLQPVSKGKATITLMYAPKSYNIICIDDTNSVTLDNWNEIPSSLIRTKTLTVEVTDTVKPDEPSVEPSEPSTEPSAEPSAEPSTEPSDEPTSSDIPTSSTEPTNSDVSENTSNSQSSSGNTNTGDASPLFPLFITVLVAAGLAALCFAGKRKSYKK